MKQAYTNANIITGVPDESGKLPVRKGAVIVENGKFVSVDFSGNPDISGCRVKDLGGKYLMPGLINMHAHISLAGGPTKAPKNPDSKPVDYKGLFQFASKIKPVMAVYKMLQENNVKNMLLSGVTTVRTVGGILDFDGQIRDKIKAGKMAGPRMYVANMAVSVPGGHFAGSLATEAKTPDEAREHVRQIAATNPDLIKIMITGGVMDATEDGVTLHMSPEIVRAACDEAHKLGYKVAAHAESGEGVKVALQNGVDTVEHGGEIDDETIALFKERNAVLIATLSPAIPMALFAPEVRVTTVKIRKLAKVVLQSMIDCPKTCLANGITVGLGTDAGCPYTTQYNTWRELVYFTKYLGVTPDFALYTATKKNAEILGIDDITGTIETGKYADFIVSEKNPIEDLTTLRELAMVCAEGKAIENPRPKKSKKAETELDKIL